MQHKKQTIQKWLEQNRPEFLKVNLTEQYKGTPDEWVEVRFRARKREVDSAKEFLQSQKLSYGLLARLLVKLAVSEEIKIDTSYLKTGEGAGNIQKQIQLQNTYTILLTKAREEISEQTNHTQRLILTLILLLKST